jgi:hypothetical protein
LSGPGLRDQEPAVFHCREKERAIRRRCSTRLEDALQGLETRVATGRVKDRAVIERALGRLPERYATVADLSEMALHDEHGRLRLHWQLIEARRQWRDAREGAYLLRTNLEGQNAEDLWTKYIQLTEAEAAFRELKSELVIRPVFHQLERRVKAHVLIAFLGYALWVTLKHQLRRCGSGLSSDERSRAWISRFKKPYARPSKIALTWSRPASGSSSWSGSTRLAGCFSMRAALATDLIRRYGRSRRGTRVHDHTPHHRMGRSGAVNDIETPRLL